MKKKPNVFACMAAIVAWAKGLDLWSADAHFYTGQEWLDRDEGCMETAAFVLVTEGGLNNALNGYLDNATRYLEELRTLASQHGFEMSQFHNWSWGFYLPERVDDEQDYRVIGTCTRTFDVTVCASTQSEAIARARGLFGEDEGDPVVICEASPTGAKKEKSAGAHEVRCLARDGALIERYIVVTQRHRLETARGVARFVHRSIELGAAFKVLGLPEEETGDAG